MNLCSVAQALDDQYNVTSYADKGKEGKITCFSDDEIKNTTDVYIVNQKLITTNFNPS